MYKAVNHRFNQVFASPRKVWAYFGLILAILGTFPVVRYAYKRMRV